MDAGPAFPHDFRVTPGGFDLERATTFVEPDTPLTALLVLKRDLFMAPDERGTGLRGRIGSGENAHMNQKNIREWAGFAVSSADPTRGW